MRVMVDTNCIDALLEDGEAFSALITQKSIRILITSIQLEELNAIPDVQRRRDLLEIVKAVCSMLALPFSEKIKMEGNAKHYHDKIILEASIRCDLLVSNDFGLLDLAFAAGVRALTWNAFIEKFLFSAKKR